MAMQQGLNIISHHADQSNIHTSNEYMALDRVNNPAKDAALAEWERKRRARALYLPTDENQVKIILRSLGEPITLFGEDKPDRRERLRNKMAVLSDDQIQQVMLKDEPITKLKKYDQEVWYHEGPSLLGTARLAIAKYSVPKAKERLNQHANLLKTPMILQTRKMESHKKIRNLSIFGSQIGDIRPVAFSNFNSEANQLATAGWSGLCSVWEVPSCKKNRDLRGHTGPTSCIRFAPKSSKSVASELQLASCGHDGNLVLWDGESETPMATLENHNNRVNRLAFHPSGAYIGTTCHDCSWRLFDVETQQELLFQEGHTKPVFDIDFQCDGSLAMTGGLDSYGRVWDLRSGRCVMFMEGHQKDIVSVNWSPNGYNAVTGSADNSVKVWDVRMRQCVYSVPAHTSLVSRAIFEPSYGNYIITTSYDGFMKFWAWPGCAPLTMVQAHENKIMCVDSTHDGKYLVTSGFDRTFKLWTCEER